LALRLAVAVRCAEQYYDLPRHHKSTTATANIDADMKRFGKAKDSPAAMHFA
jgi:hypothetical protein